MKHSIDTLKTGSFAAPMTKAVETCVHCGFCLPACPTYQELGQEADSPRGRILLIKQVLEDELKPEEIVEHVDRCLGCLACESACPSGVKYRDLISPYRATHRPKRKFWERIRDRMVAWTLPFPSRFRWAIRLGQWTRFFSGFAPRALQTMTEMIPQKIPPAVTLKPHYPSPGQSKCRVALLAGCAQQVLAPQINLNSILLLNLCGASVEVPARQGCCGALSWHNGNAKQAVQLATDNVACFDLAEYQWIVTNAAGCGSGMKEYEVMFGDSPKRANAKRIAEKTIDVSVLLFQLGLQEILSSNTPSKGAETIRVAYHDACHLSHGQNVRIEPRALLQAAPNVELVELGPEMCCGSAGTYNIEQPATAEELGRKKAELVARASADYLITGNIGCMVQIEKHLRLLKNQTRVLHLVDFLAEVVLELQPKSSSQ